MSASRTQPQACSPLLQKYREVRRASLDLTSPFSAEDQMLQSMPDCSPSKWHLAHTTWFFETFILAGTSRAIAYSIRATSTFSIPITNSWVHTLFGDRAD